MLKSELDDSVKAQQAVREKLVMETSIWTSKVCHMYICSLYGVNN